MNFVLFTTSIQIHGLFTQNQNSNALLVKATFHGISFGYAGMYITQ